MIAQGQAEATASSRVSSAKRVEQYLGDLDELFVQEDLDTILNRFAYSAEDERAERPNPSPVPIDGVLRTGLASLQQALKLYHAFLTQQANMPDKDAHQALLDRLTRTEIAAAMKECDELGTPAFLARYGFSKTTVRMADGDSDRPYPAKATVVVAVGHLPGERVLSAQEFFNGYGDMQCRAVLEKLGYRILPKEADDQSPALSRDRIEAAMDAHEAFRENGAHADVFSGFGAPSEYWVRSTRPRQDKRFPTKPLIGFLLGKPASALTGGWSQPHDAAARLHAAGYIIVDQNDEPLPLPEQYAHLMRGADRARLVALNYFIAPAREAGQPSVTIRAGDLHDMAGLVKNWANVCQALEGEMFQKLASVSAPTRSGPERSTTTEYTFVLAQDGAAKDKPMPHAVQTATTNLILYGPPGTGKTYQTAWEAVRLCLGEAIAADLSDEKNRDRLMAEYRRLMSEGRIEFVTFHQSMSYEEFVEGLRPSVDQEDVPDQGAGFRLEPVAGIFQRIARRAERGVPVTPSGNVISLDGRQVFKMSIARANVASEDYLFDEAISEGHTLLGWEDIDFTDDKFSDINEILEACREQGRREGEVTLQSGQVSQVDVFRNQLEIGDIIVVTKGNSLFRAIGEITGTYEYHQRANRTYCHRRSVRWLWVDRTGVPAGEIYDGNFTMRSIYALNRARLDTVALEGYMNSGGEAVSREVEPHVLIIDEINRANISKVFGELITLLEPDKRLGRRDEIQLTLPYSKKRFGVPPNLHIIGTMNTADRSIALLDTALRRRFTFKELMPNPTVLPTNVRGINLQKLLATINDRIEYLFDREHQIGHAYFTGCTSTEAVEDVMRHKVIPLLSEYFYEDWSKVAAVLGDGPHGPSRFLEARRLDAPPGLAADDFGAERLRWRVKDQFDFSEFAA